MAVPYSNTRLRVPKGFQNILEGLAREVLRNQPSDLYRFASAHFENLVKTREETGYDPAIQGAKHEDRFYNNNAFKDKSIDPGSEVQQEAALKIQTKQRQHSAKKEVEAKRKEAAAKTIQSKARGDQERKTVAQAPPSGGEAVDIDLTDPEVLDAATKIQAGFRGFKARKDVVDDKDKTRNARGLTSSDEDPVDIDLSDPEAQAAAVKIQATYKGHRYRKEHDTSTNARQASAAPSKSTRTSSLPSMGNRNEDEFNTSDPQMDQAARKIQTTYKRHLQRKSLHM